MIWASIVTAQQNAGPRSRRDTDTWPGPETYGTPVKTSGDLEFEDAVKL